MAAGSRRQDDVAQHAMQARGVGDRKSALAEALKATSGNVAEATAKNQSTERTPNALASAAGEGNVDRMVALLEAGVNVNGQTEFGGTAVLHAAAKGQVEAVEALLEHGALLSATTSGKRTALMAAAERDHVEVVELLARRSPELVDARDADGRTALILAALGNAAASIKSLAEAGADIELEAPPAGREAGAEAQGETALLFAARLGKIKAVRALLKLGASLCPVAGAGARAFDAARQCTHKSRKVREKVYDILIDEEFEREEAAEGGAGNDSDN